MLGSETRRHQYNLWCPQSLWMSLAYKGSDGTESLRYRNATILSFSVSLCEMYRTKMKLTATNTYVHTSIHDTEDIAQSRESYLGTKPGKPGCQTIKMVSTPARYLHGAVPHLGFAGGVCCPTKPLNLLPSRNVSAFSLLSHRPLSSLLRRRTDVRPLPMRQLFITLGRPRLLNAKALAVDLWWMASQTGPISSR